MNEPPKNHDLLVVPLRWIRLARYCEITGDTPDAVRTRRRKRQWKDGVESRVGPDGNIWINTAAVNAWVEGKTYTEAPTP